MTIGIMPEADRKREGSLSILAPRRQTQLTPTDKKSVRRESPWGPPDLPPFLGKEGDYKVSRKNSLK